MHVVDRHPAAFGEFAVDLAHQQFHFATEFFVIRDFLPAGHDHLQQSNPVAQLWETPQQDSKRLQTLRNSLGVIHAVNAQNQELVSQLMPKLIRGEFDFTAGGMIGEFFEADADWKGADASAAIFQFDCVKRIVTGADSLRNNSFQAAHKVVAITVRLEAE